MRRRRRPPPPKFVEALRAKNVSPLEVGEVIVSTRHPHVETVLQTIRELGLDLTMIFNKGAVMVLPSNVNKATGLAAQFELMGPSPHNVAGIGDAENDLPFLVQCEASAATANALESVKNALGEGIPRDRERDDTVIAMGEIPVPCCTKL